MPDLLPLAPDPSGAAAGDDPDLTVAEEQASKPCFCDLAGTCESCRAKTFLNERPGRPDGYMVPGFVIRDETEGVSRL